MGLGTIGQSESQIQCARNVPIFFFFDRDRATRKNPLSHTEAKLLKKFVFHLLWVANFFTNFPLVWDNLKVALSLSKKKKVQHDPICTIFPNIFILFCYKVINVLAAWPIFKRNCWVSIMNVMLDSSLLWWLCRAKRKTSKNRLQTRKSLFRISIY